MMLYVFEFTSECIQGPLRLNVQAKMLITFTRFFQRKSNLYLPLEVRSGHGSIYLGFI